MEIRNLIHVTITFLLVGSSAARAAEENVAKPSQEDNLCQYLQESSVLEPIIEKLTDQELGRLAQTCKPIQDAVRGELKRRRDQKVIWICNVVNAVDVKCSNQRGNFPNNDAFKQYVIQQIAESNSKNKGQWINLYLDNNNLGSDTVFLQTLLHAITDKVNALNIGIVALHLENNQLILPDGTDKIFNNLNNLVGLFLRGNKLTSLPKNIFNNLNKLQILDLGGNQLTTLPADIFSNLKNLTACMLDRNQLTSLPENIFNYLINLQGLGLEHNRLTALPENIFDNLKKLQELMLGGNQLPKKTNKELHLSDRVIVYWQTL